MAIDLGNLQQDEAPSEKVSGPAEKKVNPLIAGLRAFGAMEIGSPAKVSQHELVLFAQQLSLLLKNGNSLVPSILALARQAETPAMAKALQQVHDQLEEGKGLSECLAEHPAIFDHFFISIIKSGEASGSLQEGLLRLSTIIEIQRKLRKKVGEAMTYPIVLTCIMGAVIIFMLTFMVPRFAEIFADIKDELPWSTNMLIATGAILRSRWYVVIPIVVSAGAGIRKLAMTRQANLLRDKLKLRLPFVRDVYLKSYMFQLFSSFGLLLGSKVPLLDAIDIARQAVENSEFDPFFDRLAERVEAGHGVSQAFEEFEKLPSTVKLMVSTGETSGALDQTMDRLSLHYQMELESDIRKLGSLIEPLMLVVMGVVVGFIAISFIVPLFKLSSAH